MAIRSYEDVSVSSGPRKATRAVGCIPNDVIFNILLQLPAKSVSNASPYARPGSPSYRASTSYVLTWGFPRCDRLSLWFPAHTWSGNVKGWTPLSWVSTAYRYRGGSKAELIHNQHVPRGIGLWASPVHCDGLILVSTHNQVTVVCNPTTKEFVNLPKGTDSIHKSKVGFGFDPCSNKYKAARFFYEMESGKSESVCRFEVLTLGTSIWRRTVDPLYPIFGIAPAHVQGSLYWRVNLPSPKHHRAFLEFNLAEEKFSVTPYPPSLAEPINFVEFKDKLCCACFTEQYEVVEIWTLGNDGLQKWTRYCSVHIPKDIVLPIPQSYFSSE